MPMLPPPSGPSRQRALSYQPEQQDPAPRGQDARTRLVKLSMDLHVATSTLYKWREDAVDLTLYGAIEAGALRPYGIARMRPDAARAEESGVQG